MEELCFCAQRSGTPASASAPSPGSETPCKAKPPRRSAPSPGCSSASPLSGSGKGDTGSPNHPAISQAELKKALDRAGLGRIANKGLAYLYVVSDAKGRTKIGVTADLGIRMADLRRSCGDLRWLHGVVILRRACAFRAERRAKDLGPCVRSSWRGARTDWFRMEPNDAWTIALAAADETESGSERRFWLDAPLSLRDPNEGLKQGSEVVTVRLPAELVARMKQAAVDDCRTVTSWVRKGILDALDAADRKRRRSDAA